VTAPGFEIVNPVELGAARGFSHGILAPAQGRLLFVAGQTAPDHDGFVAQFAAALDRVLAVVHAAGGRPENVAQMMVWVTDMEAYRSSLAELGDAWRARMGSHYPAMALVEVSSLVDHAARVEIEAKAVIPLEESP
jgi:enamine deaminase RidA (YjgF/YER057c/UK114 family)